MTITRPSTTSCFSFKGRMQTKLREVCQHPGSIRTNDNGQENNYQEIGQRQRMGLHGHLREEFKLGREIATS